jgi:tRNA C32,U32 (ribose-2'-O)-methylase TrmJ
MYDEFILDIKEWLEQIEKKNPDISKDKLYFTVSYNQMNDILTALSNFRDHCNKEAEAFRILQDMLQRSVKDTEEIKMLVTNLRAADEKIYHLKEMLRDEKLKLKN